MNYTIRFIGKTYWIVAMLSFFLKWKVIGFLILVSALASGFFSIDIILAGIVIFSPELYLLFYPTIEKKNKFIFYTCYILSVIWIVYAGKILFSIP